MPVPAAITDLSTTPGNNSPPGTESITSSDDYLRTAFAFIRQIYNVSGTLALLRAQLDSVYAPITGSTTYAPIASPTFTGTVTAPAFSGSLTGAASLNVLKAGDTMTGTLNGTAVSMSGNVSAAALVPTGSTVPANGVYLPAANVVAFSTGTAERMRIDTSGNVGVGTSTFAFSAAGRGLIEVNGSTSSLVVVKSGDVARGYIGGVSSLFEIAATGASIPMAFTVNGAERMRITTAGVIQDGAGNELGWKSLPINSQSTGYTLVVGDRGRMITTTAGVTVPNAVFAAGDVVTIYNNSASAITITQGASHTLRQAGTTNTGNRTLAARGIANVTFISGTESVITGAGVS